MFKNISVGIFGSTDCFEFTNCWPDVLPNTKFADEAKKIVHAQTQRCDMHDIIVTASANVLAAFFFYAERQFEIYISFRQQRDF